jgi:hypothetical protein
MAQNDLDIPKLYANDLQAKHYLLDAKNNYLITGRGGGKSTFILAQTMMRRSYDLPRATIGLVGHTFVNILEKVVPAVVKGWQSMGWIEGVHYVKGIRPPEFFVNPIWPISDYKFTISTHTGTVFVLISQDRVASANSFSLQYLVGDEVKFMNIDKLKEEVRYAIRGERLTFPDSPHLFGETFTTDMPRLEEADWLLAYQGKVNEEQNKLIIKTALFLEALKLKRYKYQQLGNIKKLQQTDANIELIESKLRKIRRNSTFFDISSSFVNLDVIGWEQLKQWVDPKDTPIDIILSSVLSIRPKSAQYMFYGSLTAKNFYGGEYDYTYYDRFGLTSTVIPTSDGDKDTDPMKELNCGMDFGNMCSMVVFQEKGKEIRFVKEFFVLKPENLDELADQFCMYYRNHKKKLLYYYYDRAGNKTESLSKRTQAEYFKQKVESKREGWLVILMSKGIGDIPHARKHLLIDVILKEKDDRFPSVKINEDRCPCLKSSMQLAPLKINDKNKVEKVKTSEDRKLSDLPMYSTNFSDAFDYPIYQKFQELLKYYS